MLEKRGVSLGIISTRATESVSVALVGKREGDCNVQWIQYIYRFGWSVQ